MTVGRLYGWFQITDYSLTAALSSYRPPQLAFDDLAIDAVAGGYSNVRTVNTSGERSTDCPPTNYGSGQSSF